MNIMLKKTIYLLIAALVVVTSCKKDDKKTDPPTPEEAKTTMTDLGSDLGSDISEAMSSEGVDAIFSAMNLLETADPFTNKKKSSSATNAFTMDDIAGTYSWNEAAQDWDILSTPTDKVIVKFPTDTNDGANLNGVLTISTFTMLEDIYDTQEWDWNQQVYVTVKDTNFYPTAVVANVTIDGNQIGSVDFSATFDANYDPTSVSASVTFDIITLSGSFSSTATSYTVEQSLKLSGKTVESVSGTANFVTLSDEWDEWDSVYYVSGFVHYGDIKVKGSIQMGEIDAVSGWDEATQMDIDPTVAQMNQFTDLAIYTYVDDYKIADIEFYEPTTIDVMPVRFVFTDGSVLPFEEVVDPMVEEVNNVVEDDFGGDPVIIDPINVEPAK